MKINRKEQFLQAVQFLAPGNSFILQVAKLAREDDLSAIPGIAALELVATLETHCGSRCPRRAARVRHLGRRDYAATLRTTNYLLTTDTNN